MTFLAHKYCWKVANTQGMYPALVWLRMALQTRPFDFPPLGHPDERKPLYDMGPDLLDVDRNFFDGDTDIGRLVLKLSEMPLEIKSQVLDALKDTFFDTLLKAKTLAVQILPRIGTSTTLQPTIRNIGLNTSIKSLQARCTDILGRSHLADVGLNDPIKEGSSSITIAGDSVCGLRYNLGKFGLRGIQVIYDGGSCSPWLGDSSSFGWVGVIHGRDLSKLRITVDVGSCLPSPICIPRPA